YCSTIAQLAMVDWEGPLPDIGLSASDKQVIASSNDFRQAKVSDTLVDMSLTNVEKHSGRTAVIDSTGSYTYGMLGGFAYHVAGYLTEHYLATPNELIAILSEKGLQQLVSCIGIMQSGSAYLPLHVDWPEGRIGEVLQEGAVKTVLVSKSQFDSRMKHSKINSQYKWLIIEDIIHYRPKVSKHELPKVNQTDIAYVIFTSGSTGKPKGVVISHQGAVNTIHAVNHRFNISEADKVLALSELSFDLSVYDMFGLLAAGGTIVYPDQDRTKEPAHWHQLVQKYHITLWNTVPQLMQLAVDYANDVQQDLHTLRVVLMSGDWIPVKLPSQIKGLSPKCTVMSLGGATEGSIWSIWYEIQAVDPQWTSIPYGQAMPNQQMYVLNDFGEHCPVDVTGQIHIGGMGVALEYWNDREKTQDSFIEHPELGRLYRTGDWGKWNRSGYIEFEGRVDSQVKLNGYRVELGEISAKISEMNGIEKALATIQDNQLVAYVIPTKS
ncbi:amino acid adenylation domain-containing protein, partial [Croceitalea sp. MTPC5]|uniref:amino acid adenylation domain-containing protein n=1 Tax=Croceitalea sp. MTPC5 TaxID=3056565 RepID=UPI0030CC70BE